MNLLITVIKIIEKCGLDSAAAGVSYVKKVTWNILTIGPVGAAYHTHPALSEKIFAKKLHF